MKIAITLLALLGFMSATGSAQAAQKAQKGAAKTPAKAGSATAVKVDTPESGESLLSGWMDKWPDGKDTGAAASALAGGLTIAGNSSQQSYGSVYKRMNVDLDKTPYLVINVDGAKGFWYLIAKNQAIKDTFVKVQPDTEAKGKHIYDLKGITGLDGKRDLEIEIGISSGKEDPNMGKTVTLKDIKLAAKDEDALPGALSMGPWMDKWPDGKPTGATAKTMSDLTVTGISKDQYYGTVFRVVSVNLDKTPQLRITPARVSGSWYIEASGGALKAPVKIQPDTDSAETKSYDLKSALGLAGTQTFELHLGITSGSQVPNEGKEVVFSKDLSFQPVAGDHQ